MATDDRTRNDSELTTHGDPTIPEDDRRALPAGRYHVVGPLGRGGMGEVLEAKDAQLGRDVAIKRLRAADPSPRSVERFLREARIQGRLDHPAIPPVHELGHDHHGLPFFAMKKLAGTTLAKLIDDGAERPRLLRAFVDVCLAIEFAHTRGVIHRDLKPSNVMLGDFGEVYVLDWGVAKLVGEADITGGVATLEGAQHPTEAGTAIGTAGYMAPEQVRGLEDVDGRVDVYALGCILFEILAGESLHPGGRAGLERALDRFDARPSRRARTSIDIPPELDELCVRATSDRSTRIATARELGEHVQRFLDGDRDLAQRRELAREHYARAVGAFAQAERRAAMRDAGRALALDPKLAGAAELVTRLMLEPPRELPPEVKASIAAEDMHTIRANARAALYVYFGYLAFVPAIAAGAGAWMVLVLGVLVILNMTLLGLHGHTRIKPEPIRLLVCNAALVVLIAVMFSPFLVAPGVAAVTGMLLVFSPRYQRMVQVAGVIVVMCAAVLGPWIAERAGWIEATTIHGDRGIAVVADGLQVHPFLQNTMLVAMAVALIAIAAVMAYAVRQSERRVRQSLHLQAWQLRQLVG